MREVEKEKEHEVVWIAGCLLCGKPTGLMSIVHGYFTQAPLSRVHRTAITLHHPGPLPIQYNMGAKACGGSISSVSIEKVPWARSSDTKYSMQRNVNVNP